jgi:hypothetical protein
VASGVWLDDVDDVPTSARGMLRASVGATDQGQAGGLENTMHLGLQTGSYYGTDNVFGAEVNTELLNFEISKKVPTEEIDYRLEALFVWCAWRNFEFPQLDAAGEEQVIPLENTASLALFGGLGQVSEPGLDDANSLWGLPVGVRASWLPYSMLGGEVQVETLINQESLYLVGDAALFLAVGKAQLPFTAGFQYRVVTDGEDTLHLFSAALGGF